MLIKEKNTMSKSEKKRITVNLDMETYEILKTYTSITKDSMSKVLNELASIVAPSLYKVALSLQSAQKAKKDVMQGVIQGMNEGEKALRELYQQAVDILDDTTALITRDDETETALVRGVSTRQNDVSGLSPRYVTRGSTNTKHATTETNNHKGLNYISDLKKSEKKV